MDIKKLMSHPHAQVRGIHVRNQAGTSLGARRRGEVLLAAAKADHKASIGAVAEASGEVVTPRLTARLIRGVEGAKATVGRLLAVLVIGGLVLVFTWPALILGYIIYGIWVQLHSRLTPRTWIAAVAAVVTLVAGWMVWSLVGHATNGDAVKALWWALQPGLGLAYTAWLVRAWGWSAVVTETAVVTPMTGFVPVPDELADVVEVPVKTRDETTDPETKPLPPVTGFVPFPDDPEVVAEESEESSNEVPDDFVEEPPAPEPPDDAVTTADDISLFGDDDDDDDDDEYDDYNAAFGTNNLEGEER
ncbi:hypothetical protein [Corynebacterium glyciniphilum]|uniref:hypothetical protein n=1 Tax=Corynebacterium glyciniphilum TaxID=1404244 RepID=UPI0011AB8D96|nr:hypothetical protein [Corynebacterium glyciniphilum]